LPLPGTKPAEAKRRRNKDAIEWQEVDAVPFSGPKLPTKMPDGRTWPKRTQEWWAVVSSMPHCCLWDESDWQFALDTATLAAQFHAGDMKLATELRNREKVLGTTMDFRRDLRIRYVEPAIEAPAGVTAIDKYRKMMDDDG
jgi:hypothetical protein